MKPVVGTCLCCVVLWSSIGLGGESVADAIYVKRDSWIATMLATRARFQQSLQQTKTVAPEMGYWYETGPYPEQDFGTLHVPVRHVDIRRKDKNGKRIWRGRSYEDGLIHRLTPSIVGPTYLYRTITVKKPTQITALLGSDDGLAVWLNGKQLLAKDVRRTTVPAQDRVLLHLETGVNELLLKVFNRLGGHSFSFSLGRSVALDVWQLCARDFPRETNWMKADLGRSAYLQWFKAGDNSRLEQTMIKRAIVEAGVNTQDLYQELADLVQANTAPENPAWLELYTSACLMRTHLAALRNTDLAALRLAIEDLVETYGECYPRRYLNTLATYEKRLAVFLRRLERGESLQAKKLKSFAQEVRQFQREAMLANPLLDFERLMVIRRHLGNRARSAMSREIGMASLNSHNNTSIHSPATGWDNEIVFLGNLCGEVSSSVLFKPHKKSLITDVDLHFDAEKLMFSMPGSHQRWHLFEMDINGNNLRQMTPVDIQDVDFFDSCYLPNEKIMFTCTANFQGLPCEGGSRPMAPLFVMDAQGQGIRQLTFEQDSDWCPTVLNNGRVLYLRWEYSDLAHYFSRILFHMNPDGTEQMEYYGSGSYWPNAFFYARPLPNHPTQVVGIVGGHHGISRSGRLMILDPAKGRREAEGVVQEIPGRNRKVDPIIKDALVNGVWPQFLHPYPLSEKYFVVSAKLDKDSLWGIYLVDVFDNMTLIAQEEGTALLEPLPVQAHQRPPVIPEKVDLTQTEATVFLTDIYQGPGLVGIPRGTVKKLRLFSYHYAHIKTGGHASVGVEAGWDIKRVLGTVPVEDDGSALFTIPANTTISLQPLDAQGRALQIMRSWFVGMPGEVVSCVGCHEPQNTTARSMNVKAVAKAPTQPRPERGPVRPFAFALEIEPILDRHCVACHDGSKSGRPDFADRRKAGLFDRTYMALHPYTRRPGPESDNHILQPMEYHASTSELIQLLEVGHYGVKLSETEWRTLTTWIDLNVPYRGKWSPPVWNGIDQDQRRRELSKCYANVEVDPEREYDQWAQVVARQDIQPIKPKKQRKPKAMPQRVPGWPFDSQQARAKQGAVGNQQELHLDLGGGQALELVYIPAGDFVLGSTKGYANEAPQSVVSIDKPFWLGACEITNAQYALFDPEHDSRFIDQQWKDHAIPGYPANEPDQPVIRISWEQAMAFCQWLSERTGQQVTLPTEAQWEWACRAGSASPFYYGTSHTDFSAYANLADESIKLFAVKGVNPKPFPNPSEFYDFIPREVRFSDGAMIPATVGQYQANAWGLKDMHGNVAEWTRSAYVSYPYTETEIETTTKKVVRGGSWRDRPKRATASFRWGYEFYQRVYNVGFRVMIEADARVLTASNRLGKKPIHE